VQPVAWHVPWMHLCRAPHVADVVQLSPLEIPRRTTQVVPGTRQSVVVVQPVSEGMPKLQKPVPSTASKQRQLSLLWHVNRVSSVPDRHAHLHSPSPTKTPPFFRQRFLALAAACVASTLNPKRPTRMAIAPAATPVATSRRPTRVSTIRTRASNRCSSIVRLCCSADRRTILPVSHVYAIREITHFRKPVAVGKLGDFSYAACERGSGLHHCWSASGGMLWAWRSTAIRQLQRPRERGHHSRTVAPGQFLLADEADAVEAEAITVRQAEVGRSDAGLRLRTLACVAEPATTGNIG
jgi:hypothetical protein